MPVSKVFIPITFSANIYINSERSRFDLLQDVASDSLESIFLVLFWGDCQKRTPKLKFRADGISPVHLYLFCNLPSSA